MKDSLKVARTELRRIFGNRRRFFIVAVLCVVIFSLTCMQFRSGTVLPTYKPNSDEPNLEFQQKNYEYYKSMHEYFTGESDTMPTDHLYGSPNLSLSTDSLAKYYKKMMERSKFLLETNTSSRQYVEFEYKGDAVSVNKETSNYYIMAKMEMAIFFPLVILSAIVAYMLCVSPNNKQITKNYIQSSILEKDIFFGRVILLSAFILLVSIVLLIFGAVLWQGVTFKENILVFDGDKYYALNGFVHFATQIQSTFLAMCLSASMTLFVSRFKKTFLSAVISFSSILMFCSGAYFLMDSVLGTEGIAINTYLTLAPFAGLMTNSYDFTQLQFWIYSAFYALLAISLCLLKKRRSYYEMH